MPSQTMQAASVVVLIATIPFDRPNGLIDWLAGTASCTDFWFAISSDGRRVGVDLRRTDC